MLLEENPTRIEGDQGAVLFEVYAAVVTLLEDHGHTREEADAMALQLLPRLQSRWGSAGLIVRDIHEPRHSAATS